MAERLPVRRADWSGVAVHKWWEVQRDHHGKLLPRKPNVLALKVINTKTPDGRVVGVLVRPCPQPVPLIMKHTDAMLVQQPADSLRLFIVSISGHRRHHSTQCSSKTCLTRAKSPEPGAAHDCTSPHARVFSWAARICLSSAGYGSTPSRWAAITHVWHDRAPAGLSG